MQSYVVVSCRGVLSKKVDQRIKINDFTAAQQLAAIFLCGIKDQLYTIL